MSMPEVWARIDRTAAVVDLFAAHHRRLVGLASLLVDDRGGAEEVVQEAFLAVYRQWRTLRDPSAAVAYLNRCVVNGARRRLRQRGRFTAVLPRVAERTAVLDSAEQEAVVRDELDRVRRAVRTLPRREREVVVLRYYLDAPEADIAEVLGISRGSVKSYASRGLATLARKLEVGS